MLSCPSDGVQEEFEGHARFKPDSAQQVLGISGVRGHQFGASPTACDQQVQELQSQVLNTSWQACIMYYVARQAVGQTVV